MKQITTSIMLLAALTFGFIACQNENKKAEEAKTVETHSEGDGHNHEAESKNEHAHENDTLNNESKQNNEHAAGDTSHVGHNH